jgi:hypothetical protein
MKGCDYRPYFTLIALLQNFAAVAGFFKAIRTMLTQVARRSLISNRLIRLIEPVKSKHENYKLFIFTSSGHR